jgi:glycosyltransferase involved in cell wall biosynthesis
MIKILYDASVLSVGHYFAKAGIVRVVENLFDGLLKTPECSVTAYVPSAFHLHPTIDAIEERYGNAVSLLPLATRRSLYVKLKNVLLEGTAGKESVGKFRKWSLFCGSYLFEQPRSDKLSIANQIADIYHTPFRPLYADPQGIRASQRFLTVYDLIMIRYPHFYPTITRKFNIVRRAIESLTPNDWTLCISNSTKKDLCEYRPDLDPDRIVVTHLAASSTFRPCPESTIIAKVRQKYRIPEGQYILSLGTLEPRKNLPRLMRSFADLVQQERISDLSLVLVGEKGWQYDDIFKELKSTGLKDDRIIFTGFVPDCDLSALYSSALSFAYMSYYEGFGLPPLEAMQCGVPVITSNTSSLPEVVGNAGIMVPPDDGDGICQAILDLYQNSSLRSGLAAKSLERASLFSWKRCVRETVEAYKKSLNC